MLVNLLRKMGDKQNNWAYILNFGNSVIGVSILAMPFCFKECGLILGSLLLFASAWVTHITCDLLIRGAITSRRFSYEYLALHTFGAAGKLCVEISIIGLMLGTCIAFFVVIGDLGPAITSKLLDIPNTSSLRVGVMVSLGLFVALPLCLLKHLDSLSNISALTMGFYLVFILQICTISIPNLWSGIWVQKVTYWNPKALFKCLPIFSMGFSCQTQLFVMYNALHEPSLKRISSISKSGIGLAALFYFLVGYFGHVGFCNETISGDILLNFRPTLISEAVKMGFVFAIATGFPLVVFPLRLSLYSLLVAQHSPSEHSPLIYMSNYHHNMITIPVVLVSLLTGILLPNIEFVLALTGATMGSMICFIFPAIIFISLMSITKNQGKATAQFVLFLGFTILLASTYVTLNAEDKSIPYEEKVQLLEKEGQQQDQLNQETLLDSNLPLEEVPKTEKVLKPPDKPPDIIAPVARVNSTKATGALKADLPPPPAAAAADVEKEEERDEEEEEGKRQEPPNPEAPDKESVENGAEQKEGEKEEKEQQQEGVKDLGANHKDEVKEQENEEEDKEEKVAEEKSNTNDQEEAGREGKHSEDVKKGDGEDKKKETAGKEPDNDKAADEILHELKEQQKVQQGIMEEQRQLLEQLKAHKKEHEVEEHGQPGNVQGLDANIQQNAGLDSLQQNNVLQQNQGQDLDQNIGQAGQQNVQVAGQQANQAQPQPGQINAQQGQEAGQLPVQNMAPVGAGAGVLQNQGVGINGQQNDQAMINQQQVGQQYAQQPNQDSLRDQQGVAKQFVQQANQGQQFLQNVHQPVDGQGLQHQQVQVPQAGNQPLNQNLQGAQQAQGQIPQDNLMAQNQNVNFQSGVNMQQQQQFVQNQQQFPQNPRPNQQLAQQNIPAGQQNIPAGQQNQPVPPEAQNVLVQQGVQNQPLMGNQQPAYQHNPNQPLAVNQQQPGDLPNAQNQPFAYQQNLLNQQQQPNQAPILQQGLDNQQNRVAQQQQYAPNQQKPGGQQQQQESANQVQPQMVNKQPVMDTKQQPVARQQVLLADQQETLLQKQKDQSQQTVHKQIPPKQAENVALEEHRDPGLPSKSENMPNTKDQNKPAPGKSEAKQANEAVETPVNKGNLALMQTANKEKHEIR